MSELTGHISQIIGPVIDVFFHLDGIPDKKLPAINNALAIQCEDGKQLVVEVQQHIGETQCVL